MANFSELKITQASANDFKEIVILLGEISENIRNHKGYTNYEVTPKYKNQEKIFLEILNSNHKVFIAKYENKVVGMINMQIILIIRHGWKRAHLEEVVVKKEYRRSGIGSKMIKEVIRLCKENDIHVIKLLCGNQLEEVQKFYEKNGFIFKDKGYRLSVD